MIRNLIEWIMDCLGVGYGFCGGCQDPDCDDCRTEWRN